MLNLLLAIAVSASIDSTQLQLGDQTQMHVTITQNDTEQVLKPNFRKQLPAGVECVEAGKTDTTMSGDGKMQISQDMTIAGFYDTTFVIRPYAVTANNDTIYADAMNLTVMLPEGMQEQQALEDIKDIVNVPIWWWDIVKWLLLGLGIALTVGVPFYWWMNSRRNKQMVLVKNYVRPADIIALEKLDAIQAAKRWQKGEIKQYQTELTDVVREYISRRFAVHSSEKTSDETLREMKPILAGRQPSDVSIQNGPELYEKLQKMLKLADLVKFAKWQATPEENEQSLATAYEFVKTTKDKHAPAQEIQEPPTDNGQGEEHGNGNGLTKIILVARIARLLTRL
jgi:hypothetical protein